MESDFGLNQTVNGKPMQESLADLLERNERNEIEIERAKISIGIYKQMNNLARLKLDAAKLELKEKMFEKEIVDC
jgi:hypothetical protein